MREAENEPLVRNSGCIVGGGGGGIGGSGGLVESVAFPLKNPFH